MICPKCGYEQPESPECMRCGIVISRYKGPVLSAAPPPPPFGNETVRIETFPSQPPPVPMMNAEGSLYGDPAPALAGGGTVYGGPPPVPTGGTVYGGPSSPGVPTFGARPAFRGTFELGKVLGEAFSIYFKNFIPFAILTTIALLPLFFMMSFVATTGTAPVDPSSGAATSLLVTSLLTLFLGAILCPYIATAAITYGVFQQMRGKDVTIGDCLGKGLSTLFPVLGVAIVQGLGIFFGLLLCIVPGILLMLRWAVSVPAAVEERPGVGGALSRSTWLTEGYRGDIFGILFVLGILNTGTDMILNIALAGNQTALMAATGLKAIVTVGISATATAVMYYRLRSVKESIDVDQISSVFA